MTPYPNPPVTDSVDPAVLARLDMAAVVLALLLIFDALYERSKQ